MHTGTSQVVALRPTIAVTVLAWGSVDGAVDTCSPGEFYDPVQGVCTLCAPGTYQPNANVLGDVCRTCPAGTEQPLPGNTSCTPCDRGYFRTATDPSPTCEACPAGRFGSRSGLSSCEVCPLGRYNPARGRPFCNSCPRGGDCTTGVDASKGADGFIALPSYYYSGDANTTLQGFQEQVADPMWNAYRNTGFDRFGPLKCLAAEACKGGNACAEGMEGPLCGSCAVGYDHTDADESCRKCESFGVTMVMFTLFLMVISGMAMLIDRLHVSRMGRPKDLVSVVPKIMYRFVVLLAVINRNIGMEEIIARMLGKSHAHWLWVPPLYIALLLGKSLDDPSQVVFSIKCLFENLGVPVSRGGYAVVLAWIYLPLMTIINLVIVTVFHAWKARAREISFYIFFQRIRRTFVPVTIVLAYILHPMITSLLLQPFECVSYDLETQLEYGTRRLQIDTSIDCNSAEHGVVTMFAYLGVIVWSFGIPCAFYLAMWSTEKYGEQSLVSPDSWRRYGFLMDGYEDGYYYFDAILLLRRVFFLMCAALEWLSVESRTVLMLVVVVTFTSLHLQDQAFDNRAYQGLDRLETQCIFTLTLLLLGRVFEIVLNATRNEVSADLRDLVYAPAFASFFGVLSFGGYLALRPFIWPVDSQSPILPRRIAAWLDGRSHFTLIPPSEQDFLDGRLQHVQLSSCTLEGLTGGTGNVDDKKLPPREREQIMTLLAEVADVVLMRHELCLQEAPDVIFLPSFFLQMERLMVVCMCQAIKTRIKKAQEQLDTTTLKEKVGARARRFQSRLVAMIDGDVESDEIQRRLSLGRTIKTAVDWKKDLSEYSEEIKHPVSSEEIHLALLSFSHSLLDPQMNKGDDVLLSFMEEHSGLVMAISKRAPWLFGPDSHMTRLREWRTSVVAGKTHGDPNAVRSLRTTCMSTDTDVTLAPHEGITGRHRSLRKSASIAAPILHKKATLNDPAPRLAMTMPAKSNGELLKKAFSEEFLDRQPSQAAHPIGFVKEPDDLAKACVKSDAEQNTDQAGEHSELDSSQLHHQLTVPWAGEYPPGLKVAWQSDHPSEIRPPTRSLLPGLNYDEELGFDDEVDPLHDRRPTIV